MTNAELIEALRWCSIEDNEYCVDADYQCPYFVWDKSKDDCKSEMMNAAADALEELQQIADHYEQTAKDYWKEACEYKQRIEELEAQIKMDGKEFEEPTINPCRGCNDYDGFGGCKSNGGCGKEQEDETRENME